jgi:hypothetical protein
VRGKVVLFGGDGISGLLNDTWEWDGINWTQKFPVASPPARGYHALAYDIAHGVVVLFGGWGGSSDLGDTWTWDGKTWTQKFPSASPPARDYHALAYDSARGKVVLFGGHISSSPYRVNDTWEWDGSNWTQKLPVASPPKREGHALAFDGTRGKAVLFGGVDSDHLSDAWEWNGINWMQKNPAASPPEREAHALVFDNANGRIVLFGGYGRVSLGHDILSDTWEWDGQGDGKPGQQVEVAVLSTGVLSGGSTASIQKVTARFVSGGAGYPAGTVTNGVNLMAWYCDQWNPLASNIDGPKAPGLVEWYTTDAAMIQKLILNPDHSYNFAVVPQAPNGFGHPNCPSGWTAEECDMGMVSTEYAEVTLKYTLP